MKIAKLTLDRPAGGELLRLSGYAAAGFFTSGCCLEGRAPLAAGFIAACGPGRNALAAMTGACAGCFLFLPFGSALRACGIQILIYAVLAAFQGTKWAQASWFRPAAAGGAALAVELAYALQMGLNGPGFLRLTASTALSAALCHYCALLLRETSLRQRLRLSAQALRSLSESFGAAPQPQKEENPAVIFDRAAEVVCRGCALRDLCWSKEYVATFNAFNDATPLMLERGRAEPSDFAVHFASRCIHFPQLISAINTEVTAQKMARN